MTATDGLLNLANAFLLLDIERLPVANAVPALVAVALLTMARRSMGW